MLLSEQRIGEATAARAKTGKAAAARARMRETTVVGPKKGKNINFQSIIKKAFYCQSKEYDRLLLSEQR
jgi:hypothetical protein